MPILSILISTLLSATSITITEPVDGESYDGDWLTIRAIVENENTIPDSVHYSLNGEPVIGIPRLNTDWYTYMANDCRTGFSESPAPHDNSILWTAPVSGTNHEFVSPVVVDGRVYYASEEDEIAYCLDAATGTEIWRLENIGDAIDDAMHVDDGEVYFASDSIWCLNILTGEKIWTFGDSSNFFSGPPVPYQGYVFVSSANFVHCLHRLTGEEIWRTDTLITSCSMTAWNDMLFVAGNMASDPSFYALDVETGEVLWENMTGGHHDSSPAVVDSIIYIGTIWNGLIALDPFDGSGVNLWGAESERIIESTPAVHDEMIYFGSSDTVYALNRFSSLVEWKFILPNEDYLLHASAGIADGLVFWGDIYSCGLPPDSIALIHAVDCQTGIEIWNYTIESFRGIFSSPAIVDGVMYIAATDGNLYAFGTGLKYTYLDDLYSNVGSNELIVTSYHGGVAVAADTISFTVTETGINLKPSYLFGVSASPNPFTTSTSISFELTDTCEASVEIFDLSGRIVSTLANHEITAGSQSILWNGTNQNGDLVSAGLYLCRIQSGSFTETIGLCLLR
ncbi:MAG: PQQ-binding-like beta-propeller repeat protein [Candidatus Sabulitectum sp.]|nr:PQQ-binding-like beta-propeller repeat protein [Candidatus Sabulitectum sp.]